MFYNMFKFSGAKLTNPNEFAKLFLHFPRKIIIFALK